jgi:hypothetical protein
LFFDSFWVIAHSVGAAFATGAVLAAVRVVEDRRPAWLPALVATVAGAVMFRSEGMLFGLALGGALIAVAAFRRDRLAAGAGALAAATAAGAWWLDGRIYSAIVGTALEPFAIHDQSASWLQGRLRGAWSSVLRPQLLAPTLAGGLFLVIAASTVIAAAYVRFRPRETGVIRGASAVVIAASLAALVLPKAPVPGLLIAFPMLPAGLLLIRGRGVAGSAARIVAGTAAIFVAAVLATQYPVGGSMEWGGRFFHLAIPMIVPLVLNALLGARRRLDVTTSRLAGAAVAVSAVTLSVFAVGSIVRIHSITDDLVANVVTLSRSTASADDDGGPVVVSNMEAVGRLSWRESVRSRYLRVTESRDLPTVAKRLRSAGVAEFVFAAPYHQGDRHRLHGYVTVPGRTVSVGQWRLYVMRLAS